MTWTVKEALNETIGIGKPGDAVRLKVEDTFYHIGRADSYTQAMETFAEFLDAEAIKYNWITENGKKIAEIIVSKDDVYINDVNGLHFTRRYRNKTVKEALEKAFSNPECIRVYLKSKKKYSDGKGEFYQIGYAETLESALRTFGGFLDLKAELDDEDQRIAHVFVNGDDVIRIKVETDGVEGYRFYANPKRIIPETAKSKEIVKMDFQNIKPGCVSENAKCIDVQELKALLERKDDVVDALQQKILELETDIGDYIKIVNVLNPDEAESSINGLRILATGLENECKSRNS